MSPLSSAVFFLALACARCVPVFQNGEYQVPNETVQCSNDLIEWCQGMKYPTDGISLSTVSVTFMEPEGFRQYFCASNTEGVNCTKGGSPWISCTKEGQFTYKDKPLSKDSEEGTDDEVCKAADRAFNDIMVQNLSFENSTMGDLGDVFAKNLGDMFRLVEYAKEQLAAIENFFRSSFPFNRPVWGEEDSERVDPSEELVTPPDDKNSIERNL